MVSVVGLGKNLAQQIASIRLEVGDKSYRGKPSTIFHSLLLSDLPAQEKSDERLADEAQLVIAAGLLTTSKALDVAAFYLMRYPGMMVKLRQELAATNMSLDWHQLEKCHYLSACVREAIRLSLGVAIRDPRVALNSEIRYRHWSIPPGTPVSMSTADILMNESIFPESRAFIPERWLENHDLERYFVAFGQGTRQCIGINLALAELHITIATIAQHFDLELYMTDESTIEVKHAYLVPYQSSDSKGVRAKVKKVIF